MSALPSSENASDPIFRSTGRRRKGAPVLWSQSATALETPLETPKASQAPSGEYASALKLVGPGSNSACLFSISPLFRFHIQIEWTLSIPIAREAPSAENERWTLARG